MLPLLLPSCFIEDKNIQLQIGKWHNPRNFSKNKVAQMGHFGGSEPVGAVITIDSITVTVMNNGFMGYILL